MENEDWRKRNISPSSPCGAAPREGKAEKARIQHACENASTFLSPPPPPRRFRSISRPPQKSFRVFSSVQEKIACNARSLYARAYPERKSAHICAIPLSPPFLPRVRIILKSVGRQLALIPASTFTAYFLPLFSPGAKIEPSLVLPPLFPCPLYTVRLRCRSLLYSLSRPLRQPHMIPSREKEKIFHYCSFSVRVRGERREGESHDNFFADKRSDENNRAYLSSEFIQEEPRAVSSPLHPRSVYPLLFLLPVRWATCRNLLNKTDDILPLPSSLFRGARPPPPPSPRLLC